MFPAFLKIKLTPEGTFPYRIIPKMEDFTHGYSQ